MQAKSERFELRLDQNTLDRIDAWRAATLDLPSRSEAVRRLLEAALDASAQAAPVPLSLGERVIIALLTEMAKPAQAREMDPEFLMSAIQGGHYWALEWRMPGLLHRHVDDPTVLREVVDLLDMWSFIEEAAERLTEKERETFSLAPGFRGFDGNNEMQHMGIAGFLIADMGRFSRFKGRSLNAHHPTLGRYRAMYRLFEPMRQNLVGRGLSVPELHALIDERGS